MNTYKGCFLSLYCVSTQFERFLTLYYITERKESSAASGVRNVKKWIIFRTKIGAAPILPHRPHSRITLPCLSPNKLNGPCHYEV